MTLSWGATMRLWRMCTTPRTGESEAWSEVEADISLEVPHVRRPLVVSGDTSEPVKGTGTDMTRKSIQETERRNYTRYTWECVSALLLTFPPVAKAARQRRHAHIDQSNLHRLRSDPSHCIVFIHSHRHSPP